MRVADFSPNSPADCEVSQTGKSRATPLWKQSAVPQLRRIWKPSCKPREKIVFCHVTSHVRNQPRWKTSHLRKSPVQARKQALRVHAESTLLATRRRHTTAAGRARIEGGDGRVEGDSRVET